MNEAYRLIWNRTLGAWVVASELTRAHGKRGARLLAAAMTVGLAAPCGAFAAEYPLMEEASAEPMLSENERADQANREGGPLQRSAVLSPCGVLCADYNIVFGTGASAAPGARNAVVLGSNAVGANNGIAIGQSAKTTAGTAIAMGNYSRAGGFGSVVIGDSSNATGQNAVVLGVASFAGGGDSVAIGRNATATGYGTMALGVSATAAHKSSIALGGGSVTTGEYQLSVGNATAQRKIVNMAAGTLSATSNEAVSGKQLFSTNQAVANVKSQAESAKASADALSAKLNGDSLALGSGASVKGASSVAMGANAAAGYQDSIAIGSNALTGGYKDAIAIGHSAIAATGDGNMAVGNSAEARGVSSVALGELAKASDTHATAMGAGAQAVAKNATALGYGANAGHLSSVALGNGSETTDKNQVSVGNATTQRKIANLAAGTLSATSNEAVSGRQLFSTNQAVTTVKALAESAKASAESLGARLNGDRVALGKDASASATHATAVGTGAQAAGESATALGYGARVSHMSSVALGNGSETTGKNQVSVGNATTQRKIVNMAAGTVSENSNEAVSGRQLFSTNAGVSKNSGSINALNDLISNLEVPENVLNYDGPDKGMVILGGAGGTVVENLKAQALEENGNKAVTSGQLFDTNRELSYVAAKQRIFASTAEALTADAQGINALAVGPGAVATADYATAIGHTAIASGLNSSAIGFNAQATGGDALAMGVNANVSGSNSVAIGNKAQATGGLATVVGYGAKVDGGNATALGAMAKAYGRNATAIGMNAQIGYADQDGIHGVDNAFAMGASAVTEANQGVAVGSSAKVSRGADNSVALGMSSQAEEKDVVSVGNSSLQRRIVNVANGMSATDVATIGQLTSVTEALGGDATLENGVLKAPAYNVQGSVKANVGDALSALDTALSRSTSDVLAIKSMFQDAPQVMADGTSRMLLAGAQGMVLGNVANGHVGSGSREAVNGGQLHDLKEQLTGRIDGLEQRVDDSPNTVASNAPESLASNDAPTQAPAAEDSDASTVAAGGKDERSSREAPARTVDARELGESIKTANAYTDQAVAGFDGRLESMGQRLDGMDKRIGRMAAMSSAQTAMAMNTAGLGTHNRLGAGLGNSEGESALAVGYQRVLSTRRSATFSLNGAFTNSGERSVGVGVGVGW